MAALISAQLIPWNELGSANGSCLTRALARTSRLGRGEISAVVSIRMASGGKLGRIGSRRGKGKEVLSRKEPLQVEVVPTEPFLQVPLRRYKEEGHDVLQDEEFLLAGASNPFGLVLEIAEAANEFLKQNKDESLRRKPILKVISDKINDAVGEQVRDAYIDDRPNYEMLETMD